MFFRSSQAVRENNKQIYVRSLASLIGIPAHVLIRAIVL